MKNKEKLPKAFKKKWVKALLSGKYQQGRLMLVSSDGTRHCCLGVACAIEDGYVPQKGFISHDTKVPRLITSSNPDRVDHGFSHLNDSEVPFEVIAGVIDQWL